MKIIGGWGSARALSVRPWVSHGAFGMAIAIVLAGCASAPKPTQVTGGSIEATAQVNPSVNKRPSPVIVRLYELKSDASFKSADFVAMYQRDTAELAADIVAREEMALQPGESRPIAAKTLAPEVKFIAAAAFFRDIEHAQWRSIAPVLANTNQTVTVRADANAVSVTVTAAK